MSDLGGFAGKMLRVDLSAGKLWDEVVEETTLRQYLGGTGIGVKILYDEVPPGIEWDSPENRLVVASGPLGGTRVPGSGTYSVVTKGALVNGMACAQSNGFFGARLKFAGYDGVIVQGIAPKWTYIYVHDGLAELRDASHLVGLDAFETQDALTKETGVKQTSIACIGPAGENKVRFAGVCSDKGHIASSGGVGAVMGAKRLKAIVTHGKAAPPIKDKTEYSKLVTDWFDNVKEWALAKMVASVGTLGMSGGSKSMPGMLPVKNWTETYFPEGAEYGADKWRPLFNAKAEPCWACRFAHCQEYTIPDGKYAGVKADEPEAEVMSAWGPLTGIGDPRATVYIGGLSDRLGMDIKEGGFTVALALECYVKGLLTKEKTDGLDLNWGNSDAIVALLNKIARREGWIGNALAEGAMRAAQAIGGDAPKFAVHFGKGFAPHVHESRMMAYLWFSQAVSDMASVNCHAMPFDPDLGFLKPVTFDPGELTSFVAKTGCRRQFEDTLGVCLFFLGGSLDIIAATLSAVTGLSMTKADCLEVGERIVNLQRAFNLRHGKTAADDAISPRMQEPPKEGVHWVWLAPHFEKMKRDYYEQRGWDKETSKPLPDTLRRLGLDRVVDDLWEK